VFFFIIIYAVLYIQLGKGLEGTSMGDPLLWVLVSFLIATVYAVLIAQFRRRDIAILKCISWQNNDILLLLIGEVVLVSFVAFLLVFNVSVYILGLIAYVAGVGPLLSDLQALIVIELPFLVPAVLLIVFLQLPGLAAAQYRAMKIPPMRALREE
jgi:ABC-type antimicrobial peptide transport system permease subunit